MISKNLQSKIDYSISLLRRGESLALSMSEKGYFLAFSGGKDSQCLYHVAKEAGVRFEAHYTLTTLDPPELVHFIKRNYPEVIIDRPEHTFFELCKIKKGLPTMRARWCCAELKETQGKGRVTLTGVRHAESAKRAKRNEVEISGRKYSGPLDQFNRTQEVSHGCIGGRDRIVISPIINWTDNDVWSYIRGNGIEYCELYDRGYKRLGCLFCPMSGIKDIRRMERDYPKYKTAYICTIERLRSSGQFLESYPDITAEEIWEWWISKRGIKSFYADLRQQRKLEL